MRRSFRNTVLGLALIAGVPAMAVALHNHLKKSVPAADEALAASPKEIRLWFEENPEVKLSSINLLTADSAKIAIGAVKATDDPTAISADVTQPLKSGKYIVVWRTASKDGHAVRGKYAFSVK
jgi:methionine-rich copper-binding protein CopC